MDFFCHQSTASSPAHRRCNSISSNTFPACPFRPLVRPRACAWNFPRGAPSPFLSPWERGKPGSPSCSVSRGAKSSGQSGNAIPRTSPVGVGGCQGRGRLYQSICFVIYYNYNYCFTWSLSLSPLCLSLLSHFLVSRLYLPLSFCPLLILSLSLCVPLFIPLSVRVLVSASALRSFRHPRPQRDHKHEQGLKYYLVDSCLISLFELVLHVSTVPTL